MANKGSLQAVIVPHNQIRDLALDKDFFGRIHELTTEVQNRHAVTGYAAQQSLFLARRHYLNPERELPPLRQEEGDILSLDKSVARWRDLRDVNTLTVGDVVVMPDGRMYKKEDGEEVEV